MTMKYALVLAAALAACYLEPRSAGFACQVTADCTGNRVCDDGFCVLPTEASVDAAPVDAAEVDCTELASKLFDGCDIPRPDGPLTLGAGAWTYDTDTGTLAGPGASASPASKVIAAGRLISVDGFTVSTGATLRVTGTAPLVVASWQAV
ncbi:MAG: hypothetical protein KIT31_40885, partial [Deltaproteobacteria bacterium]|nr:hypothetical protein [Deltaproteobacteria bacterium]